MAIRFHSEDISFIPKLKGLLRQWIENTLRSEQSQAGEINIIFCSDGHLLALNKQYLKHNTFTDIITFDYSTGAKRSGDIFISIPRVEENAKQYKVSFEDELHRVIIHGILHLTGYTDKSSSEKLIMRQKEEKYLSLRPFKK